MTPGSVAIRLKELRRSFGEVKAVDGVNLTINNGEFFAMLGPSGSGKTTVLRLIAGFEIPDSGEIEIDGIDVSNVPPFNRDVNTVFQDYALFPHMSVQKNVEYGLRVKGVKKAERESRARKALEKVKLAGFENRKPSQLSGGQRQRVALARSIVNEPKVLLLDEPLGALDLKLRHEMQKELKDLQQSLGITFIFVTHDQEEALTMADRIAVFNEGNIVQVGSPREVYESPANEFVAGFVGIGAAFNQSAEGSIRQIQFVGSFTRIEVELPGGDRLTLLQGNDGSSVESLAVGSALQISWDSKYEIQVA